MTDMDLSPEKITYTVNRLSKDLPSLMKSDLKQAVLYGSCARGDYNSDSDIDVAVITSCGREEAKKYTPALSRISTDIAMDTYAIVNFTCIPYDEFQEKSGWYAYFKNIKRDGVSIYG